MHQNKIIKIFKTLSKDEIKLFGKFIESPIHNRHKDVIKLFFYLKKHIHGKNSHLKIINVFNFLFPHKDFDAQRVHYVNSYFLKVMEDFLAWNEWQKNDLEKSKHLMAAYYEKHLDKQFQKTLNQTLKKEQNQPYRNAEFYLQNYTLQVEQYNYARTQGRSRSFNLQELSETQDLAFIIEKLKNACILLSHQAVTKTIYNMGLLEHVVSFVKSNSRCLEIPALAIYYYAYKALKNFENDDSFKKLKPLLVAHGEKFTTSELRDIYILTINYCIRRINQSDLEYVREVFEIYKSGLEIEVFHDNGVLSPWTYGNIVGAGLKLKEYKWISDFIHNYKNAMPDNLKEGFFNYNLARYYYELKDYKMAMPLLLQMEFADLLHNLSARTLLSKMYFELGEWDALDNLLRSFKTYIYRKKVLGYHRENYLNIIEFIKKISLQNALSKSEKEILRKEIRGKKILTEKEWLLSQLT